MELKFLKYMNNLSFYNIYLPRLMKHTYDSDDMQLTLNLQETTYVSPDVLCDLLNYINYLKSKKSEPTIILFGWNTSLVAYLENTDFFLMANIGRTVYTDAMPTNSYSFAKKREFTEKIKCIILPQHRNIKGKDIFYLDEHEDKDLVTERICQQVQKDFLNIYEQKKKVIAQFFRDPYESLFEIAGAYSEIMCNSYFHGSNNYCFYTFQCYESTGLTYANSDTGMGYYNSIKEKIEVFGKDARYGLFTDEEFLNAEDKHTKSLMGIIESILYRHYNPKQKQVLGIIDIISLIFGGVNSNTKVIIQLRSDYAMLQLDSDLFYQLFDVTYISSPYLHAISKVKPKAQVFRDIINNKKFQKALISNGQIALYDYCFPGVHASVSIKQNKGSSK